MNQTKYMLNTYYLHVLLHPSPFSKMSARHLGERMQQVQKQN